MKKNIRAQQNISGKTPCDICHENNFLVIHHINGRKIKNFDYDFNLCNVCPNCHYKVHLGEIIIEKWFISSDGRILLWHNKDCEGISGTNSKSHRIK